ncbi:hypothetical protein NMY22_g7618 [Coprinellus aureogranulatus]|nr:hypothetical protein NMY22_g7618 [Coprinellus aureogranulatus]
MTTIPQTAWRSLSLHIVVPLRFKPQSYVEKKWFRAPGAANLQRLEDAAPHGAVPWNSDPGWISARRERAIAGRSAGVLDSVWV